LELLLIFLISYFCVYEIIDLFFDFNDLIDRFFLEAEDNERVKEVLGLKKDDLILISELVKGCSRVLYYYSLLTVIAYFINWFGF